ncbi:hypothetical protein DFH09DRAFT_1088621 [Mycena vulgaris]|nr:hypothetical protein DFH09DRAFT_1088621 [Mycena vulgaris]
MRPRKRCLLRPALVLAHAGALGGHGGEGMHEAPDGGAAHVERERAKDERGDDARALESPFPPDLHASKLAVVRCCCAIQAGDILASASVNYRGPSVEAIRLRL